MRAVTWQGPRNVSVETVPDPVIEDPTDAITDSVVDAVGMEAHGSPVATLAQRATTLMPKGLAPALMPLLEDGDPLGTEGFATHHLSLEDAPKAYADFQPKSEGTVNVVCRP